MMLSAKKIMYQNVPFIMYYNCAKFQVYNIFLLEIKEGGEFRPAPFPLEIAFAKIDFSLIQLE